MNDTDAFFTQTIVGAPFSVVLGRRLGQKDFSAAGIEVKLDTGEHRLSDVWNDWMVSHPALDKPGQPRAHPGRLRLLLERHALWLAALGLSSLAASVLLWGLFA